MTQLSLIKNESSTKIIKFFVPGIPKTAGSKSAYPFKKKNGKLGVAVAPANKKQKVWMADVKYFARKAYLGNPVTGPVILCIEFVLPRPKNHYGTGRNAGKLKPWAIDLPHTKTPDRTKLLRAAEDALKGVIWKDDSQVFDGRTIKRYGNKTGAYIKIEILEV